MQPSTRRALHIADPGPLTRDKVADEAWRLAYHEDRPADLDLGRLGAEAWMDFLVGIVETVEEVVAVRSAESDDPGETKLWITDEVGSWVQDFLADSGRRASAAALTRVAGEVAWALAEALLAGPTPR